MADKEFMLTTYDNPYNPFTDFENWFLFDVGKGYNTCGTLARIADLGESIDEDMEKSILDDAMDELIKIDPLNLYRKVSAEDYAGENGKEYIAELKKNIEDREVRRNVDQ